MTWEAVIGLETHVELNTRSKMFCGCPTNFDAEPNTNTCPVCVGLPGALPVPNREAINRIMTIGLALGCEITRHSLFHRKNYFYADLPKNYQISQFDLPVCVEGHVDVEGDDPIRVGIERVHQEEDTGKSVHVGGDGRITSAEYSLLDFNRSGVPLVEIVTKPDLRNAAQARAYGQQLRSIIESLDVSDARLEEGSIRFDANISVRQSPDAPLGTKVEIKNMNSFRSLERAIAHEIERQIAELDSGGSIVMETRHWDEDAGVTRAGRPKEGSSDYRYFTEPDLVPLDLDEQWQQQRRRALPELPADRRRRYESMGLDQHGANVLAGYDADLRALFEQAVAAGAGATGAANWVTGEVVAALRRHDRSLADTALTGPGLAELVSMIEGGSLSNSAAKEVLGAVMDGEGTPADVVKARDLGQISDSTALASALDEVVAENGDDFARLEAGEHKLIGFFVGQVMRRTGGKADPKVVSEMVRDRAGL